VGETSVYPLVKRALDLCFVLGVVVFLWWALILIWIAVRLQSSGPGIFAQERVGQNGEKFICYKFRTMFMGTKNLGTHEISSQAITPIGKILRKTKLDELPQIINIIKNDVTLVGPRPCLPSQIELVNLRDVSEVNRLKPGITGWAQINNIDMSDPARLVIWDKQYLERKSLTLDLQIIFATAFGRGQGDRTKS
jgi:lipopolysaccharide/colanic/teichoic acid biosynthesis glycosyltransferase